MSSPLVRPPAGEVRAPWRVVAFGIAVGASAVVAVGVGLAVVSATPVSAWARTARVPLDQWALVAALVFATWVTGRIVHGERERVWARAGLGRSSWRPWPSVVAVVVGALVILVPSLLLVAGGAARFASASATDSPAFVAWSAFALLVPAAISEELLFRGYLFDACRAGLGAWGAVGVTSALFALAHVLNPDPTVISVAAVALAGAFLGVVRLTTGSLVAAAAAHFGINYAQAVALHAPVSGLALQTPGYAYVPTGPAWLTGGAWGPEAGAGTVAALAVATFLCLWRCRPANAPPPTATATSTILHSPYC